MSDSENPNQPIFLAGLIDVQAVFLTDEEAARLLLPGAPFGELFIEDGGSDVHVERLVIQDFVTSLDARTLASIYGRMKPQSAFSTYGPPQRRRWPRLRSNRPHSRIR